MNCNYRGEMVLIADEIQLSIRFDKQMTSFFEKQTKLNLASAKVVEACGKVWADEAKSITRIEDHVDTGLYINSIGYSTGEPSNPLYELETQTNRSILTIGADVEYAEALEKRFSIFARALDIAKPRMEKVSATQIQKIMRV